MPNDLVKNGELILFGTVGGDFFFDDGFSALEVVDALTTLKGDITVRINSWGGAVNEGVAIFNALKAHNGKVTARVDGIAASAASVIVMAADEIVVPTNSMLMIHNASGVTFGTKSEHAKQVEVLGKFDGQLAEIYSARSGQEVETVQALMDNETWLTGEEAHDLGFADKAPDINGQEAKLEQVDARLAFYSHCPEQVVAAMATKVPAKIVTNQETNMTDKTKAVEPAPEPVAASEPVVVAEPVETAEAMEARVRAELIDQHQQIITACELAGMSSKSAEYIAASKPVADVLKELQVARAAAGSSEVNTQSTTADYAVENGQALWDQAISKVNSRISAQMKGAH